MNPFSQEQSEPRPINRNEDNGFLPFRPTTFETPVQTDQLDRQGANGIKDRQQSFLYKRLSANGKLDTWNTVLIGSFTVIGLYVLYKLTAEKTLQETGLFSSGKRKK